MKQIVYFPISAVGNTVEANSTDDYRDEDNPVVPDKNNIEPFGYDTLFQWIEDRKHRLARRKFYARCLTAAFLISAVLFLAVLYFGGKTAIDRDLEQRQLKTLENPHISVAEKIKQTESPASENVVKKRSDVIDNEFKRLTEEIANTTDTKRLYDFRNDLSQYDEVQLGDRKIKLDKLKREIAEKLLETAYLHVKDEFNNNSQTFLETANAFLKEHGSSLHGEEVRRLIEQYNDKVFGNDRQRIKNISVYDAGSLRQKSEAIVNFIKTYQSKLTDADIQAMQRAADLAKQFCEKHTYKITLRQYGGFAYKEDIVGNVYVNDDIAGTHRSSGKCQTANPGKSFDLTWQCGDAVRLEIQAYAGTMWGGIETVADKKIDKSPAALKMLSERIQLSPKTSGWDWSLPKRMNSSGYYMLCSVQGITEADWQAFDKYILKSSGW